MPLRRDPPPRQRPDVRKGVDLRLPNIKLYLDDVEDLVAFLKRHSDSVEIRFLHGRVDSADELRDATPQELGLVSVECT